MNRACKQTTPGARLRTFRRLTVLVTVLLTVLLTWLAAPSEAQAVVIYVRGSDLPIAGHLVRRTPMHCVVRQTLRNGKTQERTIASSEIVEFLTSVDESRLTALSPREPRGYFDYAEELAEKRLDPEAGEAALRLYLIAARLDPERLGRGALLAAVALARDPGEEARLRALTFVWDPAHDPAVLKPTGPGGRRVEPEFREARAAAAQMIKLVRRGEWAAARRQLERPGAAERLESLTLGFGAEELLEACRSQDASPKLVLRLIRAQLALDEQDDVQDEQPATSGANRAAGAAPGPAPGPAEWSRQLGGDGAAATRPWSLERVVEFDPRDDLFRNGRWVRSEPVK